MALHEWTCFLPTAALTQLRFKEACEAWLESRRPYIAAKTHHEYKLNIKTLSVFFAQFRVQEVDGDMVRAFQRERMQKCGSSAINHECNLLCQIRKRIGIPLTDYQPLPLSKEKPGRVLSDDERQRLLRIAGSNPNWEAAYFFAMISVNTTAGPREVASLRLKDIDWDRQEITIPPHGAKNIFRARPIPLNAEAIQGVRLAFARAKRLGSTAQDHYLFPFRNCGNYQGGKYDPIRHQTTFRTAWKSLALAAMLGNLKMYDLRRHAITVMLENPEISDETIEEIAGHTPNSRTKKRYSYIRTEARRKAVAALSPIRKKPVKSEKSTRPTNSQPDDVAELAALLLKVLKTR